MKRSDEHWRDGKSWYESDEHWRDGKSWYESDEHWRDGKSWQEIMLDGIGRLGSFR
jgi:hypothetical protein